LESALQLFFAGRTIADTQAAIEALREVAEVKISPLEQSGRSLWTWYEAWEDPLPATRVQFGLFADEYHDSFVAQANAFAVGILGTATPELLNAILRSAFEACCALDGDGSVLRTHPVTVRVLQRAWSDQLGLPIRELDEDQAVASLPRSDSTVKETLDAAEARLSRSPWNFVAAVGE